jgi:peptidylprolyl isomerase
MKSSPSKRVLTIPFLALLAAGVAACGSSTAPGIEQAPSGGATAQTSTPTATPTTPTSPTASLTPKSGPLSKEPPITAPKTPAPKKLVVKDLITGTGAAAKTSSNVVVNYVGALYSNAKVFDASWNRNQTFPVQLGQGQVIKGWDQGIPGMRVGGRRELIIPASLAYGPSGQGATIPPNATLIFIVDLLHVS